jgi:hypothetical protein
MWNCIRYALVNLNHPWIDTRFYIISNIESRTKLTEPSDLKHLMGTSIQSDTKIPTFYVNYSK